MRKNLTIFVELNTAADYDRKSRKYKKLNDTYDQQYIPGGTGD